MALTPDMTGIAGFVTRPTRSIRPTGDQLAARCNSLSTLIVSTVWAVAVASMYWRISSLPALTDEIVYVEAGYDYVTGRNPGANPEHVPLAKLLYGVGQVMIGHESMTAARVVAATCTVLTAICIAAILTRHVAAPIGHACGLAFLLLPTGVWPQDTTFGRTAMLEPVATLFIVLSLWAVLAWSQEEVTSRKSWLMTVGVGVTAGLATSSKELAAIPAAGAILAVIATNRGWRVGRILQMAAATVVGFLTLLITFVPLGGDPLDRLHGVYERQIANSNAAHQVGFAGRVSDHPPWWTNLWFMADSQGVLVTAAMVVLVIVAATELRQAITLQWCCAIAAIVLVQCFYVKLMLPFYWELWRPVIIMVCGVGLAKVLSWAALQRWQRGRTVIAALAAFVLTVPTLGALYRNFAVEPIGPQAVQQIRNEKHIDGDMVASQVSPFWLLPYFPTANDSLPLGKPQVYYSVPAALGSVDTVLLSRPHCRNARDPDVQALVNLNLTAGRLRQAHADRLLTMYVATGPLLQPTAEDVAQIKPDTDTTGC